MNTNVYSLTLGVLLTFSVSAGAQSQLTHETRKPIKATSAHNGSDSVLAEPLILPGGIEKPVYKSNPPVPEFDQIHSPIRWYAIENEHNVKYWESVNTNKIWIELEQGLTISDPEINSFLTAYGLTHAISESRRKHQINYWIFELENATPQQIVAMAKAAQGVAGIKFLEPSVIYKSHYTPNDPMYNVQWGPYVTLFDEAWEHGIGGNSWNVVAVIDDACDWYHEDLNDIVWYGYDFAMNDGDIYPDDPIEHKHGTHVTGTVAAKINNGVGVAGMVNDTVYFAKVGLPDGTLSDEGIVNAYYTIADIDRITAVNMSFGGDAPSAANEQGVNYAWNNGKLLIVSSGNEGTGVISFPAAYPASMAVGSIGTTGTMLMLASYSQYGNEQEIMAPGGETQLNYGIVSCIPLDGYEAMQGTSMAAPHVTGLAGLMKNLNMNLTNVDIRNMINATAFDMGDPGWDPIFGFGMINAVAAVEAAIAGDVGSVSVAEINGSEVIRLYPNPATDYILIEKKQNFETGTYSIMDITGKTVKSIPITNQKNTKIIVSELPKGVYILRITSGSGISATKFVKI